jgi:hypothetical protein
MAGGLPPDISSWRDLGEDYWAYASIMEAAHSHSFEREGEEDYETWTSILGTGLNFNENE